MMYEGITEAAPMRKLLVDMYVRLGSKEWLVPELHPSFCQDVAREFMRRAEEGRVRGLGRQSGRRVILLSSGDECLVTLSGHELWREYLHCNGCLCRPGGYVPGGGAIAEAMGGGEFVSQRRGAFEYDSRTWRGGLGNVAGGCVSRH